MDRTPTARELVVSETIQEADGILGLVLTDPTGADLAPWAPGAHVELTLPSGLVRHYSLCGDPADRSRYRLGILRERDGRGGSEEIHTSDLTGRRLLVGAPVNRFPLVEAERYVFVAGGIGITPLLPMVRHLAGAGAPWSLVYGARTREAMAYVDELSGLTGGDVTLVAQDTEGHPDLDQALKGLQAGTVVYACGPEALLRAVEDRCEQWPARGALHVERFGSAPEQDGTREQGTRRPSRSCWAAPAAPSKSPRTAPCWRWCARRCRWFPTPARKAGAAPASPGSWTANPTTATTSSPTRSAIPTPW